MRDLWFYQILTERRPCARVNATALQHTSSFKGPLLFFLFSAPAKMKKPKLLNKFDKTIKAEIDAAEKLRKKVTSDRSTVQPLY